MPRAQSDGRMQVALLDLRRQYASMRGEILSALTRAGDSRQFIMGPEQRPYVVAGIVERGA